MATAFILYFVAEVYYKIKDDFISEQVEWSIWDMIHVSKYLITVVVLVLLILFMKTANHGQLFSSKSNKLWIYKSSLLLINGSLSFIETRFHDGDSLHFASYIFLASFCFAMSAIFKKAETLQQENDLTI
jgi:hypothetical protein